MLSKLTTKNVRVNTRKNRLMDKLFIFLFQFNLNCIMNYYVSNNSTIERLTKITVVNDLICSSEYSKTFFNIESYIIYTSEFLNLFVYVLHI